MNTSHTKKQLIAFLGTGNYQPHHYRVGDTTHHTRFTQTALAKAHQPEKIIIFVTAEASDTHQADLTRAFAAVTTTTPTFIHVPSCKNEREIWQLFDALTTHIAPDHNIIFDTTHGFRAQPILALIALGFLREIHGLEIHQVCYGALEAQSNAGEIPFFDLTPFISLLDWTSAANAFRQTGDASHLGQFLEDTHQSLWKNKSPDDDNPLPTSLKNLGRSIVAASQDLILLRTQNIPSSAESVRRNLEKAREKSELDTFAKPFLQILDPIESQLSTFQTTDLATLRKLIQWLTRKKQTAAALTLTVEWLTTWLMETLGESQAPGTNKSRAPYNDALSHLALDFENPRHRTLQITNQARKLIEPDTLRDVVNIANRAKSVRNDINHAAYNASPLDSSAIRQKLENIADQLHQLPLPSTANAPSQVTTQNTPQTPTSRPNS